MKMYATMTSDGEHFPVSILKQLNDFWNTLKLGEMIELEFKRPKRKGTRSQQNAFFALVVTIVLTFFRENGITHTQEVGGVLLEWQPTKESIKDMLYTLAPKDETGKTITLSKMDTVQRVKFFTDCQHLATHTWGLYIPDPDPDWAKKRTSK